MTKEQLMEILNSDLGKETVKELGLTTLNKEVVNDYLANNNDGKSIYFSITDKAKAKGVEEYKTKYFENEVQKRLNELNPTLTEEQKKIKELELELQKRDREILLGNVKKELGKYNSEVYNLPQEIMDIIGFEDIEKGKATIDTVGKKFKAIIDERVLAEVNNRLKNDPKPNNVSTPTKKELTLAELENMSSEQRKKLSSKELFNIIKKGVK